MLQMYGRRILIVVVVVYLLCSLPGVVEEMLAQQSIELTHEVSYPEGLSFLSTVRELSDGSVMFADPLGQVMVKWNAETGAADTLGRVGQGPQEYRQPDAVFPLPADSTLLLDLGNSRLTVVGPDGVFGETHPVMRPRSEGFPMTIMPRYTDAQGRIYFYQSGYRRGARADSAFVARLDRGTDVVDTIGVLRIPIPEFDRVGNDMVMTRGPLLPRDDWAVGLDGSVAIVRVADYTVEWILGDGSVVRGDPTAYRQVRISSAEQERWADEALANQMSMTSSMSRDGGAVEMRMMRGGGSRPELARVEWPDVLPPFHAERIRVSEEGELWVERYSSAGSAPVIDVFDGQGNKTGEVTLPAGSRVVGFGDGVVYLARADEFDLQWLARYRIGGR